MTVTALATRRREKIGGTIRCKAATRDGSRCRRRAQWEGLCFQHWRMERKGQPVARIARI